MKYSEKRLFFRYPFRSVVQLLFLIVFLVLVFSLWGVWGVHNLCPWAVVEVPVLMLRLKLGLFYVAGLIIGLLGIWATLYYPRPFCGWVCPLGTLFDFIGDVGAKMGLSARRIPHWLNEKMRYFAFGVMALLIVVTLWKGFLACTVVCPVFWICTAGKLTIPALTILILLAMFILSIRVKRGFCRYICPYGALTSMFVPMSRRVLRVNVELCISCRVCSRVCPMGIDLLLNFEVGSAHCISCFECAKACPRGGIHWERRKRRS